MENMSYKWFKTVRQQKGTPGNCAPTNPITMKTTLSAAYKWLLMFAIAYLPLAAIAQQVVSNAFTEQELRNLGNITPYSPGVTGFDNRYEGVKGSPYWYDTWQNGYVVIQGKGKLDKSIPLQLDLYNQVVYFRIDDKVTGTLPAKSVQSVILENGSTWRSFPEADVTGKKSEKWKFYRVLHQDKYLLLVAADKILKKADYQGAYSADRRYDEFLMEEGYYLSADQKSFEKIKLKSKQVPGFFPGREARVQSLIKKNGWDTETEAGFVQLLQALEQE